MEVRGVLNFDKPIALMLVALLHGILDEDKPADIVATLVDALPSGSYLVASHLTMEHDTDPGGSQRVLQGAGVARKP